MRKSFTDQLDLFAQPLPTFNLDGQSRVSSCVGSIASTILYLLMFGYAVSRAVILFGDGNPVLSDYKIEG